MPVLSPFPRPSKGDAQRVLSGVIHVFKFGLQWKYAPEEYGSSLSLTIFQIGGMGIFKKRFTALFESAQDTSLLMIDATRLKIYRTAASLRKKGGSPFISDEQQRELNSNAHAVRDVSGRPIHALPRVCQ